MRFFQLLLILICLGFAPRLMDCGAYSATTPQPVKPTDDQKLDPVMDFLVVRSSDAHCEPDCPEWIAAEGRIEAETAVKLAKFLADPARRKLPLILNSGGGSVYAALAMGRLIRKYKMDTAVGRTEILGCTSAERDAESCKPDNAIQAFDGRGFTSLAYCASACPLVLLGGIHRVVDPASFVGVHEPQGDIRPFIDHYLVKYRMENGKKQFLSKRFVNRTYLKKKTIVGFTPQLHVELDNYFKEMGGSLEIFGEMKKAQPESMNWISFHSGDRERLGLVTANLRPLVSLVGAQICIDKLGKADNCIHLVAKEPDLAKPIGK